VVVASLEKVRAVDAPGRSQVGDYAVLRLGLTQEGGSTRIGNEVDHCVVVGLRGRQLCTSAFLIRARGRLAAEGVWNPAPGTVNVFPITGGTGDFAGAGGTARFEDLGDGRVRITFEILT
jgi:hypothetical protein